VTQEHNVSEITVENEPSRLQRSWQAMRAGARSSYRGLAEALTIDRVFSLLAVVLLPAGIAAIALGWTGASRTPFLFEQIPYLISGGLLGVGLLTAGGLLYLGSWIARSAQQARERDDELRAVMTDLRDDLRRARTESAAQASAVPAPDAAPAAPAAVQAQAPAPTAVAAASGSDAVPAGDRAPTTEVPTVAPFVATPSGTMFHRPDCSVVANRSAAELRRVTGDESRMRPCGMCDPLGD
jgi:hypothetical protein